jgi:histidine ammonia-lyase
LRSKRRRGVALLNGTDGMLGMQGLACLDAARLFGTADVVCAMCVEALLGTDRPFRPELHALRPHPGQTRSAANLARLLDGSEIVRSHRGSDHLVQDAYSLRCHPQVVGACRDTLDFANGVASRELGSAVDNPVVMPDGRVESTGNFHGQPLAFACDFLAIAAAEVGSIAERRIDRLLDPARSQGLPPFLAPNAGVNSGLMIAHYTAAALVAENRRLAVPASVDSLPTSAMQEDHVPMGWGAAMKLRQALENLPRILAVEVLAASYALCMREPLRPAPASSAVVELIFRTSLEPTAISHVFVGGQCVVRNGRLVRVAQESIVAGVARVTHGWAAQD